MANPYVAFSASAAALATICWPSAFGWMPSRLMNWPNGLVQERKADRLKWLLTATKLASAVLRSRYAQPCAPAAAEMCVFICVMRLVMNATSAGVRMKSAALGLSVQLKFAGFGLASAVKTLAKAKI